MPTITVEICGAPAAFDCYGQIRVVWQSRIRPPAWNSSPNNTWTIELAEKDGKWSGPAIGRNSDGRRFLYFAWISASGQMFRRIKLYQDQCTRPAVRLCGSMTDGSPACSTARILED
jgi:hypothetical protein